jgi:hypothetical protein
MERLTNESRWSPALLLERLLVSSHAAKLRTARYLRLWFESVFVKEMDEPQGSFLDDLRERLEFLLALSQLVLKHET